MSCVMKDTLQQVFERLVKQTKIKAQNRIRFSHRLFQINLNHVENYSFFQTPMSRIFIKYSIFQGRS